MEQASGAGPSGNGPLSIIQRVPHKAVLFDAGETIVHPHPSFPELLAQVLRTQGHHVDPATIRDKVHVVADIFTNAAAEGELWSTSPQRSRVFWDRVYRRLLGELDVPFDDPLASAIYGTFTDLANYRLFPDVLPTLDRLAGAGLKLGVVSNFEEWLERLLESLGVTSYFEVRVISGVEGVEKPDPQIFRLALERMGVDPGEAVYVGDSVQFDVEPAKAVGMVGVLLDRRDRHPDHEGIRLTSLEELPAVLELAA
jgi:putative hydrolase of the HAD superfamily